MTISPEELEWGNAFIIGLHHQAFFGRVQRLGLIPDDSITAAAVQQLLTDLPAPRVRAL